MTNPYSALADHQFWRRSVSRVEAHLLDPVVKPRFAIHPEARVATAGSCFAQHISRKLAAIGFTYFVAEQGDGLAAEDRVRRGYGTFSARYGNIYTAAQLRQLFDEAFGRRVPLERCFRRGDGRLVDAFRPQIEPDGFATEEELLADRAAHLAQVRQVFEQADVFIFTLGLTEAWRTRSDGSVFPIAPGVVAGDMDPERHEFVNFEVEEVQADLEAFLAALKVVNPGVRVLLTVSPVPLIATYEDRHVLVATTYSKSVLRVAADKMMRRFDWVDYFPSYEIITGSYAGGLYYEDDYREVNHLGVAHAMRCFAANYAPGGAGGSQPAFGGTPIAAAGAQGIICDEEVLDAVRI